MKRLQGERSTVSWVRRHRSLPPLIACLVVFLVEHAAYGADGLVFKATTVECTPAGGDAPTSAVFEFTNHAERAVGIKKIRTSCGCVEAKSNRPEYESGQEGQVKVVVKPTSKKGQQQKTIIVETDDPSCPRIVLLLRIKPPETESVQAVLP